MYTFKYKDASPEETIKRCKSILKSIGVDTEEKVFEYAPGLFSAAILSKSTGEFSNGKGISKDYSLASGYAEFLERLQNQYFVRYLHHTSTAFNAFPDEKKINFAEYLKKRPEIEKDLINKFVLSKNREPLNFSELVSTFQIFYNFNDDDLSVIPFYSVRKKTTVDLPAGLLAEMTGSNGECAGNTPQEAIAQGLCEILERWSEFYVTFNNLTPPRIEEEWLSKNFPETFEKIQALKKSNPDLNFEVLDFSLGWGIPSIGILALDTKNSRYRLQMGSHPLFNIALERCCTEMVQGVNLADELSLRRNFQQFSLTTSLLFKEPDNVLSRSGDGTGSLPLSIFQKEASWEFKPWSEIKEYDSNKGLNYLVNLCLNLTEDIYIRDNSFLSFPSYYIYIPGMSIPPVAFNEGSLEERKLQKIPFIYKDLTDDEIKNASDFLVNNYGSKIIPNESSNDTAEDISAAIHLAAGNVSEAISVLKNLSQIDKRYLAVISDIEMALISISEEERDAILEKIYGKSSFLYCKNRWRGNLLYNFFSPFTDSENILYEEEDIINEAKKKIYLKLLNYPFNQDLRNIFENEKN